MRHKTIIKEGSQPSQAQNSKSTTHRNGIGLDRRIPLAVHLNHILENPMRLGRRLLGTGLGIGVNHGVERVFVGANVQIIAALFAKLFHPGENLFGSRRCHLLAAPGPCLGEERALA